MKTSNISPYLGTEVTGVQLSELSAEGRDELALFVAERKVVIFRDQDFKDIGPDRQIEFAKCVAFFAADFLPITHIAGPTGILAPSNDTLRLGMSRATPNSTSVSAQHSRPWARC